MRIMKESGIPFAGSIPETWSVMRGKYILSRLQKPVRSDDGVVTCFRDGEVTLRSNRREDGFTMASKECGYQGIDVGDLVVHGMDGFAGAIGISDSRGKVSPVLNILDTDQDKRFIKYYLRSMAYGDVFTAWSTGIRVRSCDLGWNKIAEIRFLVPPILEQRAIADYLDKKCELIDSAIASNEKELEKLIAYRQELITNAVTKGLNSDAQFKESGIKWIGLMPNNWDVLRVKYIALLKGRIGWDGLTSNEYQETGPYLVTGTDLLNGTVNWDSCVHVSEERYNEDTMLHLRNGDLLITKDGTIGKVAVVADVPEKATLNSGVMIIRSNGKYVYNEKYIYYVLLSAQFQMWFELGKKPNSTILHLYQHQFENFKLTFPPLSEQKQIAAYLDDKCMIIDRLVQFKQQQIEKLKDYKKSLIYACVTGKKEVFNG